MKQLQTKQVDTSKLPEIDIAITASGYEKRSSFIAMHLEQHLRSADKICCIFSNYLKDAVRINNDTKFRELGYLLIEGNGDDGLFLERILADRIKLLDNKSQINILIDYSSMTRVWYASVLRFLYYFRNENVVFNAFFSYSFSKYEAPPKEVHRNVHVSPIEGFSTFAVPDKPTALIIGLGYEPEKAYGLTEYFDAETFLFYNDSSVGMKFSKDVESINSGLLNSVPTENVYTYPITNLSFLEKELFNLCRSLKENYRVIIAPCGPKPFSLISLLMSLRLPEVDVWRISPGKTGKPIYREANGKVMIYQVCIKP